MTGTVPNVHYLIEHSISPVRQILLFHFTDEETETYRDRVIMIQQECDRPWAKCFTCLTYLI